MAEYDNAIDQIEYCGNHSIDSHNILLERETGRVVAVFYNDYDLNDVLKQLEKANMITVSKSGLIQVNHNNIDLDQCK